MILADAVHAVVNVFGGIEGILLNVDLQVEW